MKSWSFEVRTKGLEPPRRKTLDPKSSAATNYATCASRAFRSAKLAIMWLFPKSVAQKYEKMIRNQGVIWITPRPIQRPAGRA